GLCPPCSISTHDGIRATGASYDSTSTTHTSTCHHGRVPWSRSSAIATGTRCCPPTLCDRVSQGGSGPERSPMPDATDYPRALTLFRNGAWADARRCLGDVRSDDPMHVQLL